MNTLCLLVYYREYNSGTAKWSRCVGKGMRGRVWSFHATSRQAHHLPNTLMCSSIWMFSLFKSYITQSLFSLPGLGERLKIASHDYALIIYLLYKVTASILRLSRSTTLSHLISIDSDVFKKGSLWVIKDTPVTQEIPRVLGALC